MTQIASLVHISQCCKLVLSKYILLREKMKSQNVPVNIVLVSKCQSRCCWKLLLLIITKYREESLDRNQD